MRVRQRSAIAPTGSSRRAHDLVVCLLAHPDAFSSVRSWCVSANSRTLGRPSLRADGAGIFASLLLYRTGGVAEAGVVLLLFVHQLFVTKVFGNKKKPKCRIHARRDRERAGCLASPTPAAARAHQHQAGLRSIGVWYPLRREFSRPAPAAMSMLTSRAGAHDNGCKAHRGQREDLRGGDRSRVQRFLPVTRQRVLMPWRFAQREGVSMHHGTRWRTSRR
jgi:hypothetical protein